MSYSSGYPGMPFGAPLFCIDQTWLAGMTVPQLTALLGTLITARGQFGAGGKPVSASYSQGDGSKAVTFNITSRAQLEQDISMVQKALGMPGMSRRPMRPMFNW
jgi:hypothetical protein